MPLLHPPPWEIWDILICEIFGQLSENPGVLTYYLLTAQLPSLPLDYYLDTSNSRSFITAYIIDLTMLLDLVIT